MGATYSISSLRDYRPGNTEMPVTAIVGHPYIQDQCAALALFNRTGSGRKVTISEILIKDMSAPNNAGTAFTDIDFMRITGYVGGESAIVPQKHDPNNDSLPAGVVALEDCDSVTTSGTTFRAINIMPWWNETQSALNRPGALTPGNTKDGINTSTFFYQNFSRVTDIQGLILREGEGFCIMPRSNAVYYPVKYKAIVKFRKTSNSHCYSISNAVVMAGDRIPMVLFNTAGSGVVLEIYQVDLIDIGSQIYPNLFSVERIDSCDVAHSLLSDISLFDSNNESLVGKIDYRREANVSLAGHKTGAIITRPIIKRDWQTSNGGGNYTIPNFESRSQRLFDLPDPVSNIILREGEGIAVFKRTLSSIGAASIYIRFQVDKISLGYSKNRIVNV